MQYELDSIKAYIIRLFSDDLRNDKSIGGDMERKQLQKWLLTWARDKYTDKLLNK